MDVVALADKFCIRSGSPFSIVFVAACYLVWIAAIFWGHIYLFQYEAMPSFAGTIRRVWPSDSQLSLVGGSPNMVMFVHPDCPAATASVTQLQQLMERSRSKICANVVVELGEASESAWMRSSLHKALVSAKSLKFIQDFEGHECALFGPTHSGQLLIYDGRGVLRFSGGIIQQGGKHHFNRNAERARYVLTTAHPEYVETSNFGTLLRNLL
ncbi:MAG TPA: hypothetical protein V6D17_18340 [Candidatus Obscuribacterales bacterium]